MREFLKAPVTDLESAKAYITALVRNGLDYHLDDDPGDLTDAMHERVFGAAEVPFVRRRVARLYAMPWPREISCPIGYMTLAMERYRLVSMTNDEVCAEFNQIDVSKASREELVALLEWNDHNGDYEECTITELIEIMIDQRKEAAPPPDCTLVEALRGLLNYTGGWDITDTSHPIYVARKALERAEQAQS